MSQRGGGLVAPVHAPTTLPDVALGPRTGGTLAFVALALSTISELRCVGGRTLEPLPDAGFSGDAASGATSGPSSGKAGAGPHGGGALGSGGALAKGGQSGSGGTTTGGRGSSATGGTGDEGGFGGELDPGTCGGIFRFRDGPYRIKTQADAERLRGFSEFSGHLVLEAADDFSPLRCLTRVGDLTIDVATAEIRGLENLTEVLGDLDVLGTPESLGGLSALRRVWGEFSVGRSPSLVDLRGLDSLAQVGHLSVSLCENLRSLRGLDVLHAVDGDVHITDNPRLEDVALPSTLRDLGTLIITRNPSLASLSGLRSLEWIRNGLDVSNNHALYDLHGLESLLEAGIVQFGPGLESLAGLENLTVVHGTFMLESPELPNLTGLDSLQTVANGLWISAGLTSLDGAPVLENVGGGLRIRSPLTTFQGLARPLQVQGTLELVLTHLTTLDGLENVSFDGLTLFRNSSLANIAALSHVTSLDHLYVKGNESLPNLDGLENLAVVRDGLLIVPTCSYDAITSRNVCRHNALTNLRGLRGLTSIGGPLHVFENPSLPACEADWLLDHVGIANIGSYDVRDNTGAGPCP
jgi:hypothetical protein